MDESDGLGDKDVFKSYAASRNQMRSRLKMCEEGVSSLLPSPVQTEVIKLLQEALKDLHPINESVVSLAANLMNGEDIASIEQELSGVEWREQPENVSTVRLARLEELTKDEAKYRLAYNLYRNKVHNMRLEVEEKQAELCDKDAQIVALQARCTRMEEELSIARHAVTSKSDAVISATSQASALDDSVDGCGMDRKERMIWSLKQQLNDEQQRTHQAVTAQARAESDLAHAHELHQELETKFHELSSMSRDPGLEDLVVARGEVDDNALSHCEMLSLRDECQKLRVELEEAQQLAETNKQQEQEILSLRQSLCRKNADIERLQAQANLWLETPSNMTFERCCVQVHDKMRPFPLSGPEVVEILVEALHLEISGRNTQRARHFQLSVVLVGALGISAGCLWTANLKLQRDAKDIVVRNANSLIDEVGNRVESFAHGDAEALKAAVESKILVPTLNTLDCLSKKAKQIYNGKPPADAPYSMHVKEMDIFQKLGLFP